MLAPWSEPSSLQGDEKPISTFWITQSVYAILLWQPQQIKTGMKLEILKQKLNSQLIQFYWIQ